MVQASPIQPVANRSFQGETKPLQRLHIHNSPIATSTYAAEEASLVKKTAQKGGFYVSSMPAGIYRVTLQKAGYAEQTLTVYVNNGELTTVDVKLAKV